MTANLIGKQAQIKYSFNAYMDASIKEYFRNLEIDEPITLVEMVQVVLALYNKGDKTEMDYDREFVNIKKKTDETVAAYYLRVHNCAARARVQDLKRIRDYYKDGLTPDALYKDVCSATNNNSTLAEVHAAALKCEDDYNQRVKRANRFKENSATKTNEKSMKTNEKSTKTNEKNSTPKSLPTCSTSGCTNKVSKANFSICPTCYKSTNEKTKNKTDGKSNKPFSADCKFCGQHHDQYSQLKACIEKFKHYSPEEIAILREIKTEPRLRKSVPEHRITRDSEWVKKKLENAKKDNNSSHSSSKKV
jgi:hypothetical protein